MSRVVVALWAGCCVACTGASQEPAFCGDTTWSYTLGTVVNEGFVSGRGCFAVDETATGATFRIPVGERGHCRLEGTLEGPGARLVSGACVVDPVQSGELELFLRWRVTGGTATRLDGGGWAIRAEFEVVVATHDGTYAPLDVDVGTGVLSHDGYPGGTTTFRDDWGVPCTPGATYATNVTGRVAKAEGAQASCDALLADLGATHAFTYTFEVAAGTVTYGERPITYALLPDRCLVAFDESSGAWKSRLDLDAKTVTIRTRQTGPYVQEQGAAQCELEWTGTLAGE